MRPADRADALVATMEAERARIAAGRRRGRVGAWWWRHAPRWLWVAMMRRKWLR